jgi:uncharacterized membrane protein YqjE
MTAYTHSSLSNGPLKRLIKSLFRLVQTRLSLIGIELAEEKARLSSLFVSGLIALLFGISALVSFTLLIVLFLEEAYRWQALAGLTIIYALITVFYIRKAYQHIRHAPPVFEATMAEFKKDYEALK